MIRFAAPMIAATLLAGCAATPAEQARSAERRAETAAELDKALAGYTAGKPQNCLPITPTRQARYYGDTILYEISGNLIYRTDTTGGCGLARDDILITRTPSASLCRGDIARTVDRGSRFATGSCAFGEFIPYRKSRG